MRKLLILATSFLAACSFNAGGIPTDSGADGSVSSDGGSAVDGGSSDAVQADGSCQPKATIACSKETVDGHPKLVLTFGGDIESGFLDEAPHCGSPLYIEYGSDYEGVDSLSACSISSQEWTTWTVPYDGVCNKPYVAWGDTPKLYLDPQVDYLNLALVYGGGAVRWGDLKTSDGDGVGFSVSGKGDGYDCRIELVNGGTGGNIRTHP